MSRYRLHFLVCTHGRSGDDPRGCCSAKGSQAVLGALRKGIAERGLRGELRANASGCLDQCAAGVSVVVYPEGTWYGGVREADVEELLESHLGGNGPVERLQTHRSSDRGPRG